MVLVSVIVPAYNAQDTLRWTIEDILGQSFRDFELILVDDGSTDHTLSLCEEAAAADARVRVIALPENGGLSLARNTGTTQARGTYVTYIDSDDRVESCYLEYLVRAVNENGARIACGRVDRVPEGYKPNGRGRRYEAGCMSGKEALGEMLTGRKLTPSICCKLILRECMLACPFPEGKYYEDLSNTWKVLLTEKDIAFVDAVLYHYCMRGGSITGRMHVTKKQCRDYYDAIRICVKGTVRTYPELKRDAAVLAARDLLSLYLSIRRCRKTEPAFGKLEDNIWKWIKKYRHIVRRNKKAPLGVRLRVELFSISPALYETLYYVAIRFKKKHLG